VIGVLEEDRAVGLAVQGRVVARLDQRPGLAFLLRLALDELDDVGVVGVEDDHLGGPARLAAALDDPGEGVEALHEGDRPRGDAAARQRLDGPTEPRQVDAGARAPLEDQTLGLGQVEDRLHGVADVVDVAGGGLLALALDADVEPDRRVEGDDLVEHQVGQLVGEDLGVLRGGEVVAVDAPLGDGPDDAAEELLEARLAIVGAHLPVEVLRRHDVGGALGPEIGELHTLLLEDGLALGVEDDGRALLPLHGVVGMDLVGREVAGELEPIGTLVRFAPLLSGRGARARRRFGDVRRPAFGLRMFVSGHREPP